MPAAPASAAQSGIVAAGLRKSFGGVDALPTTDLWAPGGEVTVLEGQNGAGKTTLLRILATLVVPDAGEARIAGVDLRSDPRLVRDRIGVALVNERSLWWRLTGRQNLELFGRIRGLGRRDRRTQVEELLTELGLTGLGDRPVHALSAGQRQRLVLGRALVGSPAALLIDEPLRGLDPDAAELVIGALQERASAGAAVLVATPSLVEYEGLASARRERVGASAVQQ